MVQMQVTYGVDLMRNFTMANPKELFMLIALDEQKFPAPKSFFNNRWKKRVFDEISYFWCGRYETKKVAEKYGKQLRGIGKRYRITKSGNQYLLWCNDCGVVDYNIRASVPI